MSFSIQQGLFNFDLIDYHAILGVALDATPEQIRQCYLKIAYQLHPDTCKATSDLDKQRANDMLSKLVNPAYEHLSNQNKRQEYQLLLTQIGARLAADLDQVTLTSEAAQKLVKAGASIELMYPKLLKNLSQQQYRSLDWTINFTSQISELNLVYLSANYAKLFQPASNKRSKQTTPPMAQKASDADTGTDTVAQFSQPMASGATSPREAQASQGAAATSAEEKKRSPTDFYIRRAQDYLERGNYSRAIVELRDSLKVDPNHGPSHGLMGLAYLKQQQLGMAKVHINKASAAAPNHPIVESAKQELAKVTGTKASQSTNKARSDKEKGGGFLGGLFGGKRK